MEPQRKHRLIGGFVILAIIAIFLPLLFHHQHPEVSTAVSSQIPTPPQVQQIELQLPQSNQPAAPPPSLQNISNSLLKTQTVNPAPQPKDAAPSATPAAVTSAPQPVSVPATAPAAPAKGTPTPTPIVVPSPKPVPRAYAPPKPDATSTTAPAPASQPLPTPPTSTRKSSAPYALNTSVPDAWTIQVATFSDNQHAQAFLHQLREKNLSAYVRSVSQQGRPFLRVYVGPQISREKTDALLQQLKSQYGLSGLITKYEA